VISLKKLNFYIETFFFSAIFLVIFLPRVIFADDAKKSTPGQCYKLSLECDAILIKGNYFKAAQAVYEQDLKNELAKFKGDNDESRYLSNINNYDFYVEPVNDGYKVGVGPTMRPGAPDYFGGIHYVVDAKTFKILKREKVR
jgi:hypothetical protein